MALARVLCPTLIGRESELSTLEDALLSALRGDGGVVIVGGEAGMARPASSTSSPRLPFGSAARSWRAPAARPSFHCLTYRFWRRSATGWRQTVSASRGQLPGRYARRLPSPNDQCLVQRVLGRGSPWTRAAGPKVVRQIEHAGVVRSHRHSSHAGFGPTTHGPRTGGR
jgi:hypothetical protein